MASVVVNSQPARAAPPPPAALDTSVPQEKPNSTPVSATPRKNTSFRSMLDIAPPRPNSVIPEETHSTDGSEPHEAVTPTSSDFPNQFHHGSEPALASLSHSLGPQNVSTTKQLPTLPSRPAPMAPPAAATPEASESTSKPRPMPQSQQSSRRPSKDNSPAATPSATSPPSPSKTRPTFMTRARSLLKRSNTKNDLPSSQQTSPKDEPQEFSKIHSRTNSGFAKEPNPFSLTAQSSRTSPSATPPSPGSANSTVNEAIIEEDGERLTKSKTSASTTNMNNMNRFSAPRGGITWGTHTAGGLTVPVTAPRKRSASTEQVPKIRKPNERVDEEDEDDDEDPQPRTELQGTFSIKASAGVGLKARRLSLTLPDDFVVQTKPLEKEFKSTRVFHTKGTLVGRGATATVTTMVRKDGPKDELYAVKEFRGREKDESEHEWSQKIKSEYTLANSVNHPNIVRTFDLCIDKRKQYCHVMEFCPIELYSLVERGLFREGRFYTFDDRLCFFKQILRAVDYLHEHGIAHRDVKLENILMNADGHLKLTDFGVSEVFCGEHPGARTSNGLCGQNMREKRMSPPGICGSYPYISPEVMSREVEYDPSKLDTWSCGVLWLTLCCSGNLWARPDESNENFRKFMKGWNTWSEEHPNTTPDDTTGYPKCGNFMKLCGKESLKKLILRMMHPNPDRRITIHEALENPVIKSAACCSPESFEDQYCFIDASKKCKPKLATKQFKHNHIPPAKEHKLPKAFQHRFDMGDGY